MSHSLADGWTGLVGPSHAAGAVGAELLARWAEPHRRYHTPDHLRAVLAAIDTLAPVAADLDAVRLAAWFHDAVYEGRAGSDEERSAQLALSRLPRCGVPGERVAEVARLVRLTATHDPDYTAAGPAQDAGAASGRTAGTASGRDAGAMSGRDANGAVLCDADLAVLAGDAYPAYASAVRREYAHVPDELFRQGRAQMLRRLLAAPRLYRTALAHELWEGKARANMAAELAALES
ncbi:HD domain-containing protein [Nonomuraea sp. bgisy101]|uniref:HD domain-containing protein n=1 Tax=Nonomuraea sp. bgisy101 TaxID=3413784 RepID=UPI003D7421A2